MEAGRERPLRLDERHLDGAVRILGDVLRGGGASRPAADDDDARLCLRERRAGEAACEDDGAGAGEEPSAMDAGHAASFRNSSLRRGAGRLPK